MVSPEVEIPHPETATPPGAPAQSAVKHGSWLVVLQRGYVAIASVLLTILIGNWLASKAAENVDLKAAEREHRETVAPVPGLSQADLDQAKAVLNAESAPPTRARLLYLGDSQVFSRPDAPAGALNTPQWLQILLARQDDRAVRLSIGASPGMDVSEMLLKVIAAAEQKPRLDDIIVTDVSIAELRELGVRSDIVSLASVPSVHSALKSLVAENPDLQDAAKTLDPLLNADQQQSEKAVDKSLAEKMEDALQHTAERWSFFAQRENLVRLGLLRYAQWEHRLLHITSDTRIPTPVGPYRTNLQLLELLMRYAQARGIHLLLFFGPVRNLEPNPDAPADLARMHRDVTSLCQHYGVTCLDYSQAIPEGSWAEYAANQTGAFAMLGGHDFYHFTEAGHKALAEKLASDVGPSILQWSKPAGGVQ